MQSQSVPDLQRDYDTADGAAWSTAGPEQECSFWQVHDKEES